MNCGFTEILFPTKEVFTPISFNKAKVIFMYGTDVISPSRVNSKPFSNLGAINNKAEIY